MWKTEHMKYDEIISSVHTRTLFICVMSMSQKQKMADYHFANVLLEVLGLITTLHLNLVLLQDFKDKQSCLCCLVNLNVCG